MNSSDHLSPRANPTETVTTLIVEDFASGAVLMPLHNLHNLMLITPKWFGQANSSD